MSKTIKDLKEKFPQMDEITAQFEKLCEICEKEKVSIMLIAAFPKSNHAIFGVQDSEKEIIQSASESCLNNPVPASIIEKVFFNYLAAKTKLLNNKYINHVAKNRTRGN